MTEHWNFTRTHWIIAGALVLLFAAGAMVFYFTDPVRNAWLYPQCNSYRYFGIYCPGCGSTRAFHALLHGDAIRALRMNPLALAALPCVAAACFRPRWFFNRKSAAVLTAVLILYAILRNIYPALAPV